MKMMKRKNNGNKKRSPDDDKDTVQCIHNVGNVGGCNFGIV
jgi:hypothetical protein